MTIVEIADEDMLGVLDSTCTSNSENHRLTRTRVQRDSRRSNPETTEIMAEAGVETNSRNKFFCHKCSVEINPNLPVGMTVSINVLSRSVRHI